MARRRFCAALKPRLPTVGIGKMDGMTSRPSRRRISSTKSTSSAISVRHDGMVTSKALPSSIGVTEHPTSSKREKIVSLERSEEHTSELQSRFDLVCRLLLEKKKKKDTKKMLMIEQ